MPVNRLGLALGLLLPLSVWAEDGEALYFNHCATCHQVNGSGVPSIYPALAGSAIAAGDAEVLAYWVLNGNDPSAANEGGGYMGTMPSFSELGDAEIAAILSYVREKFAKNAGPVAAETVAGMRDR